MDKNKLVLEELYTGYIFDMDDSLTMEEIFERQNNQRKRSQKLNDIKQYLIDCNVEDFFYVIIKILKDKTPVITVFNDVIFSEKYLDEVFSVTRRQKEVKEALFNIHSSPGKWYYETLMFNFSSQQQLDSLLASIQECLEDKKTSISGYKISIDDCPILRIEIEANNIKILMNPDKATKYMK